MRKLIDTRRRVCAKLPQGIVLPATIAVDIMSLWMEVSRIVRRLRLGLARDIERALAERRL
jgi:hypothetical protein